MKKGLTIGINILLLLAIMSCCGIESKPHELVKPSESVKPSETVKPTATNEAKKTLKYENDFIIWEFDDKDWNFIAKDGTYSEKYVTIAHTDNTYTINSLSDNSDTIYVNVYDDKIETWSIKYPDYNIYKKMK